jgi:hypothetical protein
MKAVKPSPSRWEFLRSERRQGLVRGVQAGQQEKKGGALGGLAGWQCWELGAGSAVDRGTAREKKIAAFAEAARGSVRGRW